MKGKLFRLMTAVSVFFLFQGSMLAHHGTSAYDMTKEITLKGTVTSFEFINPHSSVHVDVIDEAGRKVNWLGECNSINRLVRRGWNRDIMKPGDVVTITGNPVRSGAPSLRLTKIVLPDGKELNPQG